MKLEIKTLAKTDVDTIWAINEEGLPGTGKVSRNEIIALLDLSGSRCLLEIGRFCDLFTSKNRVT